MRDFIMHESSHIHSSLIGEGTRIFEYVVILDNVKIGENTVISANSFIDHNVIIGNRVTVKSGVYISAGAHIDDDVFIGPNVTFAEQLENLPRDHSDMASKTRVSSFSSIGGGSILCPGVIIGRGAVVKPGSVVTQSVPPYAIVFGSPAQITGYVETPEIVALNDGDEIFSRKISKDRAALIGVGDTQVFQLKIVKDLRGDLSVGEFQKEVPFVPQRYFLVFNVPSEKTRGEHAHFRCHQFLICVKGSCAVVVDDGYHRREITLDKPEKGLYIPPLTWGIQYKYSKEAVLLVFASHPYDPQDYIRDYALFIQTIKSA